MKEFRKKRSNQKKLDLKSSSKKSKENWHQKNLKDKEMLKNE